MATLLDSLTSLATPAAGRIAQRLGETETTVARGLETSLASVLGGLVTRSGDTGSMRRIFDLITSRENAATDNMDALLSGATGATAASGAGASLLTTLFDGRVSAVGDLIARTAGFKNSASGASLLGMVAPLVLGYLGKRVRDGGLNVAGLTSMLASERDSVLAAAPPGLMSLLDSGGGVPRLDSAEPLRAAGTAAGATAGASPREAPGTPYAGAVTPTSSANRWLWPLLGLAALALIWFVVSRGRAPGVGAAADSAVATGGTALDSAAARTGAALDTAASRTGAALDTAAARTGAVVSAAGGTISEAARNLGAFVKRTLPGGVEINIPERGIESNLIAFIEDPSRPVNDTTWFNFDRLNFATGSATILPESQEQLNNIAAVFKAYPNVNVKIGGYTDSTGDAAANRRLSQQRADAVRQSLVAKGIAASRMQAEGYGDQHPVGDNSTEEGRAKNRRIALRVTKK